MRLLRKAGLIWTGVLLGVVVLAGCALAMRWLLPLVSTHPELLSSTPLTGTPDVSPRSRVTLRFSAPMNPRTVERALRIEPVLPARLEWNADHTTLTISPTLALQPEATYRIIVDERALSRWFAELERPVRLAFTTAPAPAVVAVFPSDGSQAVPPDSALSISFSRPIVAAAALAQPTTLPQLHLDPPISGTVTWLDQATVLFRPAAPLSPGTHYRATLDDTLAGLDGGQLGQRFSWSFATVAPRLLAAAPLAGAQGVAPRAPLTLRLSQPFELAAISASLTLTPSVTGVFSATSLPDATQLVTFTPTLAWQPGQDYTAELRGGAMPLAGNLALLPTPPWSFQTAPRPRLIGRFPGEGQTLPPGQPLRLTFTTPVDAAALQEALRFTPPVEGLQVSASETEARIEATFSAGTFYTVTLSAELTDRNNVASGQEYRLRFLIAPAAPALSTPQASDHVAALLPGAALAIQRTNLTALDVELYRLDEAAIVRALAFSEREWTSFNPARTNQQQLNRWRVPVSDPLNTPITDRLELTTADGAALPAGAYFVRIRTPEGPRADLLVLFSRVRLLLQADQQRALVWATGLPDGAPLGQLPVALYRDGAVIERGVTDAQGLWLAARLASDGRRPLIVVAGGAEPAVASSAWADTAPLAAPPRLWLTTDRASYPPGASVALAGFVRAAGAAGPLVPVGQAATLTVQRADAPPVYEAPLALSSTGAISASFGLPPDAVPGVYTLTVALDHAVATLPLRVTPGAATLAVEVAAPPQATLGGPTPLQVRVRTADGLPLAGASISWTLQVAEAGWPSDPIFRFGDPSAAPLAGVQRHGSGPVDATGGLTLVVTDTALPADRPLAFRLLAEARGPGRLSGIGEGSFVAAPAQVELGISLPERILTAGVARPVELLARTPAGLPLANQTVRVRVLRQLATQDELALTRSVATDANGRATLPLVLERGGIYRVLATTLDSAGRQVAAAAPLWVTAPGFNAWPSGPPALIADRSSYRPGDTARLLWAAPLSAGDALVTVQHASGLAGTLQRLRPGELLTVTLQPDDPPLLPVLVALSSPQASRGASTPEPLLLAGTLLALPHDTPRLTVTLASDQPTYAPGATALLTVTTTDARGQGVPADILLGLGDRSAQDAQLEGLFDSAPPVLPLSAQSARVGGAAPAPPREPALFSGTASAPVLGWRAGLRTGPDGLLRVALPLPDRPQRAPLWATAAAPAQYGQARLTLTVTAPLQLTLEPPPLLRAGDVLTLSARLHNSSPLTQSVRLVLNASGLKLAPNAPPIRQVVLAPGATVRLGWPAQASGVTRARVGLRAQPDAGSPILVRAEWPIQPAGDLLVQQGGAAASGVLSQSIELAPERSSHWGQLLLVAAPSSAALAEQVAQQLAVQPDHSALDDAGLLLLAAQLEQRTLGQPALERLVAAQQHDGGWGWWRGDPSDLFVTAVVLEALAADPPGLRPPARTIERGIDLLQRREPAGDVPPALRAYLQYVYSLYNLSTPATLRELAQQPQQLGPVGLAYLLLARSPGLDGNRPLVELLMALSSRTEAGVFWDAQDSGALPESVPEITALAALALERHQPDSDLLPSARRWLLGAHRTDGWGSGLASAHVLAALLPYDSRSAGYQVALNGVLLLDTTKTTTLMATHQLTLTLDQLRLHNSLVATGTLLLSYRLEQDGHLAGDNTIALLREHYDPLTGLPLKPASLRAGQLVEVRLTVVTTHARRFVTIEEPLPGGATLLDSGSGSFDQTQLRGDRLWMRQSTLAPGIYQQRYLLRMAAPGRYTVPAPSAQQLGQDGAGRGNPTMLVVR